MHRSGWITPAIPLVLACGPAWATPPAAPAPMDSAPTQSPSASGATPSFDSDLRLTYQDRHANPAGPLAAANALRPGIVALPASSQALEWHSRGRWGPVSADVRLAREHTHGAGPGSGSDTTARFNELEVAGETAGWAWNAGKKVVAWDVGQGYRPNDVVQQEQRRTLLSSPLEGRPLLQLERFGPDDALSIVWVNPHHLNSTVEQQHRAEESALAARLYRREGPLDLHGTARLGRRTGVSAGAALAWVAGDEVELHTSARWLQRRDSWAQQPGADNTLLAANPWQLTTLGATDQALIGGSWTGASQVSLLAEAWHDGSAPSRRQWRDWLARNRALVGFGTQPGLSPALQTAATGNLAWQATPLDSPNLQRDNLFLRLAWQPENWQLSLDGLYHPADAGRLWTAGLQWQGDRWRLNAAWRRSAGPAHSVLAQLPSRTQVVLTATWTF